MPRQQRRRTYCTLRPEAPFVDASSAKTEASSLSCVYRGRRRGPDVGSPSRVAGVPRHGSETQRFVPSPRLISSVPCRRCSVVSALDDTDRLSTKYCTRTKVAPRRVSAIRGPAAPLGSDIHIPPSRPRSHVQVPRSGQRAGQCSVRIRTAALTSSSLSPPPLLKRNVVNNLNRGI